MVAAAVDAYRDERCKLLESRRKRRHILEKEAADIKRQIGRDRTSP
jgi:hypothetical protein